MQSYTLSPGIVKVCAGLLQSANTEPYLSAIAQAEQSIWDNCPEEQQDERQRLLLAIKDNLTKPRSPKAAVLLQQYNLNISESTFRRNKRRFCWAMASALGLTSKK